jgi:hypothetical protein
MRAQEPCKCEEIVITDFLSQFNDHSFTFTPGYVDGPPQRINILDLYLMSSACGTTNHDSFCGQLKYCFVSIETGKEIISWPEKGITYVASANQLTLQPLAGDATGIHKILVRIYRFSLENVVREVELQFLIKPAKEP